MAELMVAGALLSAALNVMLDRLASRQVVDFFQREKLGEGLLKNFEMVLQAVNVLLDDAEMKEFLNPGVKKWLDDLKDAIYHAEAEAAPGTGEQGPLNVWRRLCAEDLLDEIFTMATQPNTISVLRGGSMIKARRVEEIIEKIDSIVSQKDVLGLSEGVRGNLTQRDTPTSLAEDTFIGRDAEKRKIVESLMMGAKSSQHLDLDQLSDDSSWELFENHAFGKRRNVDPHLEKMGRGIVKKCNGMPLAIKTLAGALRDKDDVKDWEMIMKSEIWDSTSIGNNDILPALKLSYYHLPANIKRCFAYCSIFPKDYRFIKETLVLLWMAEGFLLGKDNNMEELGDMYFDELVSRSFFQKSNFGHQACFVMHGLMNDLAQYVSGEFCHALQICESRPVSEKVRHFSNLASQSDNVLYKIEHIVEPTNLRTVLGHFNSKFLCDLLPKLGCVRVLSLAGNPHITELPESISILVHLRYLNLSRTALKCLPNKICQLYNLQTLVLSSCLHLVKLPTNLGELVNLRHLDISQTFFNKLPPQIRNLESLRTLSRFIVREDNCSGLGDLNGLRHLKGSLLITGLHNVKNVEDAIEANLKEKTGIKQLSFEWGEGVGASNNHSIILDKLQPSANLNDLALVDYGGTRFSNWLGDGSLSNLTHLKISDCVHCSSLPSFGQLPSLLELHIEGMTSVRQVDSSFYGNESSSVRPFRKLTILKFAEMPEWKEWSHFACGDNDDFPKLETLSIRGCPKLCGNLPKVLPSLRNLCIEGSGGLIALIPGNASPRSLTLKGCKNVVFENMSNLNSLISLEIGNLESNSFPNGMMENCANLKVLTIRDWSSLTQLPNEGLPTTLRELNIIGCGNLKDFSAKETFHIFKHLERLKLNRSCDSMTSFPLGLFPNLKNLTIYSLKNLESFSIKDLLPSLSIYGGCDELVNLPSGGGLPTPSLRHLFISSCKILSGYQKR